MANLAGLRIGLLTASASRLGGGVFEAVASLAALIRGSGGDARVFALRDRFSDGDAVRFAPAVVRHADVAGPVAIGFAPELLEMLLAAELDCLHLHGIWMYPSRVGRAWALRTRRPYLISPHGMLDSWITRRGQVRKLAARIGYERASWGSARAFHALTRAEARDIARETGREDTLVIPNCAPPARRPPDRMPEPSFVYIGRIHRKKNLAALIGAWSRCVASVRQTGARLTIAGWGADKDVAWLRRCLAEADPSIAYVGACFGEDKRVLLDTARFVVLPSLSEGLPIAILEAWASGVPTIMSAACGIEPALADGAALDSGYTVEAIASSIETSLALDQREWLAMSRAACALASGPFAAATIAEQWTRSYRAVVAGEPVGAAE